MYYELTPAYRNYKTKAEVIEAFKAGKDFHGDYQLNFRLCSIADFKPGDICNLRYSNDTKVAPYKCK